jgi:hypothetical protein
VQTFQAFHGESHHRIPWRMVSHRVTSLEKQWASLRGSPHRVIEITPWKERVWGVGLFIEGGLPETVGDGGALKFG